MERRQYDKEFKIMAINLLLAGKKPKQIAEELGIRSELVNRWKREYDSLNTKSFPGKGKANLTEEQLKISKLEKALREVEIENEILKKAISIFSRKDGKSLLF